MTQWVMDYETLSNCFVAVFEHYTEKTRKVFAIHSLSSRTQFDELIQFLIINVEKKEWHISYNGLAFDSQLTQYILLNYKNWVHLTNDEIARLLYKYAQYIITGQEERKTDFPEWVLFIKQIDLFKMNHWDNAAKRSGLKWIQYSMDWDNVEEMPIHHTTEITSIKELEEIIKYCINDVRSTKRIFESSKEQLALRVSLSAEYDINLHSASETRISKELFAHFLSKKTGIPKHELKRMKTERPVVYLGECIFPYISFESQEFKNLLEFFKGKVIKETKGSINHMVHYKGIDIYYGLGGIHGAVEAGVYDAGEGYTIMTSDVTSFYPNLAIRNKLSPGHLPQEDFCTLYEWIFEERKKIPKSDPKNYVYKIILNATYGLSNDENSFLYDPKFTMSITINGQLLLTKLYEMLLHGIPGAIPIMLNTDGLEMKIPSCYKTKYLQICEEWEKLTMLALEHDEYQKMIIGDVNNYIAIPKDPEKKAKCKGRFEWEDLEKKKVSILHKNKSFLVIPKAIYHYFIYGTKPEDYLKTNRNIMDYCGGVKAKGDWKIKKVEIVQSAEKEAIVQYTDLQKINRYYISKAGAKLIKCHKDSREIQVEAGKWLQQVFNKRENKSWEDYHIDDDYYIQRIYKEIHNIDKIIKQKFEQLTLF